MKLYYCPQVSDTYILPIQGWHEYLRSIFYPSGETVTLHEAKRITGDDYFFCRKNGEVGEVGQGCGKQCDDYAPRNGKNGRCRHSGYCYDMTDKTITITLK